MIYLPTFTINNQPTCSPNRSYDHTNWVDLGKGFSPRLPPCQNQRYQACNATKVRLELSSMCTCTWFRWLKHELVADFKINAPRLPSPKLPAKPWFFKNDPFLLGRVSAYFWGEMFVYRESTQRNFFYHPASKKCASQIRNHHFFLNIGKEHIWATKKDHTFHERLVV